MRCPALDDTASSGDGAVVIVGLVCVQPERCVFVCPAGHSSSVYTHYYQGQTSCCHLGCQNLLSLPPTAGNMRYS